MEQAILAGIRDALFCKGIPRPATHPVPFAAQLGAAVGHARNFGLRKRHAGLAWPVAMHSLKIVPSLEGTGLRMACRGSHSHEPARVPGERPITDATISTSSAREGAHTAPDVVCNVSQLALNVQ